MLGLNLEPVAVLRDVLNLDGARDAERQRLREGVSAMQGVDGPPGVSPAEAAAAQARSEARLKAAYRAMLLQLQSRYDLERDRAEERHRVALAALEERHAGDLLDLASSHDRELAAAAGRLEREAAERRAEVQRLEAQLAAARAAADASHGQVAAARAATEALQAQLQLQRAAHEAELQHVRQGSMPLEQHEEAVRQLEAQWEAALAQRERDYAALLGELAGLRRQLSSSGGPPSVSSGSSCGPRAAATPASGPAPAASHAAAPRAQEGEGEAGASSAVRGSREASAPSLDPWVGGGRDGVPRDLLAAAEAAAEEANAASSVAARTGAGGSAGAGGSGGQDGGALEGRSGAAVRPASPALSCGSEALSFPLVDEAGSAVLEVSATTINDTPQSRHTGPSHAGQLGVDAPDPCATPGASSTCSGLTDLRAQSPPSPLMRRAAGPGAGGGAGLGAIGTASGQGMMPAGRSAVGPPSAWAAGSANPVAGVPELRCLRCGLNDASSPGSCRFHPALLPQPGSLMFSPEWMACQAAGHTRRTPGCLRRGEHFYAPLGLGRAPAAGPAGGEDVRAAEGSRGAFGSGREGRGGDEEDVWDEVVGYERGVGVGLAPPRSPSPRHVRWASPPAVKSKGLRAGAVAGGAAAGGGGGPCGSPSPQPRSRLPAPVVRR
ncbi:hypothetical protein HYH03_005524 [Edaphochlamys debaryana]|uniref:Uncharacterized protein n=1 Tax=Edaphochlamys debaryana TaxID=47281 RepID=A0A835Y5C1_9CHLO|nr:hypothetical protein HYH03_005524 [Edaphochlamys debaryana]|eukprot:KAG2496291.1 hypothetical protein HYH03_005524 [Edaphochlamys debaryana]